MPEMKIKLAKIEVNVVRGGWSAKISGTGDEQFFSKFYNSKDEAEAATTALVDNVGCELSVAYQEKQKEGSLRVWKNWDDFQIIKADELRVPEPVSDVRAKRISEQLSRVADARKVYELGMELVREDWSEQDKASVILLAINLGWNK